MLQPGCISHMIGTQICMYMHSPKNSNMREKFSIIRTGKGSGQRFSLGSKVLRVAIDQFSRNNTNFIHLSDGKHSLV